MIGRRFGALTVLARAERPGRYWLCRCDCHGKRPGSSLRGLKVVSDGNLYQGSPDSCGCMTAAKRHRARQTHGMSQTSEYRTWKEMRARCENTNGPAYRLYGGRGITVCERWRKSFEAFLADMGPRPSRKHSLDRKNVNGNYEPANCRWATSRQQNQNRRDNVLVTYKGETKVLRQWARERRVRYLTLYQRIVVYHWSPERAFETPVAKRQDRTLRFEGKKTSIAELAARFNMRCSTLYMRIFRYGWPVQRAVKTPTRVDRRTANKEC